MLGNVTSLEERIVQVGDAGLRGSYEGLIFDSDWLERTTDRKESGLEDSFNAPPVHPRSAQNTYLYYVL